MSTGDNADSDAAVNDTVPELIEPAPEAGLADDDTAGSPEPSADLPVPPYLGTNLEPGLRGLLHDLLATRDDQLGEVYRAMTTHQSPPTATQLLAVTSCRNSGIVANRRVVVYAVFNAVIPPGPSVAL